MMPRPLPILLLLSSALPALANDGVAGLGNGGLVLDKTDKIEMRAEDLYLSTKEIRIAYRFLNRTAEDVTLTVAFPMPDITGSLETEVDIPNPKDVNFLNFTTKVDGKPTEATVEQRAFLVEEGKPDVELTDELKGLNLPLMPTAEAAGKGLAALPEASRADLVKRNIVAEDGEEGGDTTYVPLWTLRAKFIRRQTFPAGKEILVEQRYQPSIDTSNGVYLSPENTEPAALAETKKSYCLDAAFLKGAAAIEKRNNAIFAKGNTEGVAFQQTLSYVVMSGLTWAGPIGEFRLVVDKRFADNLVSFCGTDVKKISPTSFEMRVKDFVPKQDIQVMFIERHPG